MPLPERPNAGEFTPSPREETPRRRPAFRKRVIALTLLWFFIPWYLIFGVIWCQQSLRCWTRPAYVVGNPAEARYFQKLDTERSATLTLRAVCALLVAVLGVLGSLAWKKERWTKAAWLTAIVAILALVAAFEPLAQVPVQVAIGGAAENDRPW